MILSRRSSRDSRKRSIVKAICYRTIVSIIAFMIAYWATESITKSIHIIILYLAGSMIIYYIHERVWERISWGR